MKYSLRPYQQMAVEKIIWSQQFPEPDICVLPTGSGKSIVIAELAKRLNQPVLILQPSKEILEQNMAKLMAYVSPTQIGVYSASLNRKELNFFTFATIQSIYKKPELFKDFKQVIIDECHLVNPKNLDGMFTTFLKRIENPKVVGLTATPYRLDNLYLRENGNLYTFTTTKLINRIKERFWHRIVFNINNEELVKSEYLCPLRYIDKTILRHEEIPTNISKSDFNLVAYEQKISSKEREIIESLYFAQELSRGVLVFCSSVDQAENLQTKILGSEVVTAKTKKKDRERIINGFRSGEVKMVFNVGVLTTGFDHPALDCIVLLRPTRSIGLYYQMLGRGVRICEGKRFCRVIDMTDTVNQLGKIETIKLMKRDKWELESEKGSWHNKPLYRFEIKKTT